MDISLGEVVEKVIEEQFNIIDGKDSENCDRFVFTNCRNIKPKEIYIWTNPKSTDWQIGFFDADGEVYFDKIKIRACCKFSSIVRNYWQNGKEGEERREGYYSLVKSVKKLGIQEEHVSDLLDYVEGRYEVDEYWQLHELDRSIELRIYNNSKLKWLQETTVERLQKYFDNIQCNMITVNLKTVNNITYNCGGYLFRNCKGVVPQKLVINTTMYHIHFDDIINEVHIPEIVMEEKADFRSIIQNKCGYKKYYSLLPHAKTLIIRNNPKVLCDLMDYINGKYKIINKTDVYLSHLIRISHSIRLLLPFLDDDSDLGHSICQDGDDDDDDWDLCKPNKKIKIVIEKPGIAFNAVKKISGYFTNVMVDNNKPKQYLSKQQPYQKSFQQHLSKYNLKTDQIRNLIPASQELRLEDGKFNVGDSSRRINELHVDQKIEPKQFICFHDTDKPVIVNTIVIEGGGDLRCVLQNVYYNETNTGFFNLLKTAKNLKIKNNEQAVEDLADYIDGKYTLHPKWARQALDKNIELKLRHYKYPFSPYVARRFRNYFRNISINYIQTPLETENVIDQECENCYIFTDSRKANPQKLVVNAKLAGSNDLILFNNANSEVCIPEITISEHGSFDAVVRNKWWNSKNDRESKNGYYSLVSHVETLNIQNNREVIHDLDKYVSRNYKIKKDIWKIHKLSKNILVRINGVKDLDEEINRLNDYFGYIVIDDRKALGNQCRGMLANIKLDHDKIQQQGTANADKRATVARADAEIAETKRRIENARARLGRRRARFQEYLALAE